MVAVTELSEKEVMAGEAKLKKEEGNVHFKAGRYDEALACYTKALELDKDSSERGVYLKNRAAVHLKLDQYKEAVTDATQALEISPNDPKALFRRCQAYEGLETYEEAYKDAAKIMQIDPKNSAIQPILRRLNPIIQKKVEQHSSTENKVKQMFELVFDQSESMEKRRQAAQNLIVLARENAGAEYIYNYGGLPKLLSLMEGKDDTLQLSAIRTIACMCLHSKDRAIKMLEEISMRRLMIYIGINHEEISTATANIIQNIIKTVTKVDDIRKDREKYEAERIKNPTARMRAWAFLSDKIDEDALTFVDQIFSPLVAMLSNAKVSAYGRDNVMELLIKYVTKKEGLNWSKKIIQEGGIQRILEVAGTVKEHKTIPSTENSRMHASLLLSKIWEDLFQENDQKAYQDAVDIYFQEMFGDNILESKLEAVMALTALLQGPFEVGNRILGKEGVLEIILAMADSNDAIHTKYAVEALVNSASKKERCSGVIKQATPILKQLYQSKNDYIKVRALVGLCKLGSLGGHDVSARTFAEGSTQTLAKACRKFLVNPSKDVDLRKWAAEGLAYLTLDADVKEDLVADTPALKSLMDLARATDKGVLYPVAQILVNVTNSYDVKKIEPELIEIAKFAKQHIPETHEKDGREFAEARTQKLVDAGVVNALVALSTTESESSRELLARVYLSVCTKPQNRGLVIQQGGAKALIPLALEGTQVGKQKAAHALAKISITNNPAIAFPGQRANEVVRPILQLLNVDLEGIENYEGLLALTNLASMNDTVRTRIVKEKGISMIEHYCFEDHEDLKRAAMEALCNMAMDEQVAESFEGTNDRTKMFLLFCLDEDIAVVRAAAGGLAMLTSRPNICKKILVCSKQWYDVLTMLMVHELPDIQHRGVHIIMNMMQCDKEVAQRLVESNVLEMLMALSKVEEEDRKCAKACAEEALDAAVEHKLIEENPQVGKPMQRAANVPKVEKVVEEEPEEIEQEEEILEEEKNKENENEENMEEPVAFPTDQGLTITELTDEQAKELEEEERKKKENEKLQEGDLKENEKNQEEGDLKESQPNVEERLAKPDEEKSDKNEKQLDSEKNDKNEKTLETKTSEISIKSEESSNHNVQPS